jgi:protein involved in ribonucleotide reduction
MFPLVYFSSQSENTHRFILRLGLPARRILTWHCATTAAPAIARHHQNVRLVGVQ